MINRTGVGSVSKSKKCLVQVGRAFYVFFRMFVLGGEEIPCASRTDTAAVLMFFYEQLQQSGCRRFKVQARGAGGRQGLPVCGAAIVSLNGTRSGTLGQRAVRMCAALFFVLTVCLV